MKKLVVLLVLGGMLMLAASIAQAQSEWASYLQNPAKICEECPDENGVTKEVCYIVEGYQGARVFTLDPESTEIVDGCTIDYYTVDCSFCHGEEAHGNHDGAPLPGQQGPPEEVSGNQVDPLSAGSQGGSGGATGNNDPGPGWVPPAPWSGPEGK